MHTNCDLCGTRHLRGEDCPRCSRVADDLKLTPESADVLRDWVKDVVDTRIEEAIGKHENRYYHNRRPEY